MLQLIALLMVPGLAVAKESGDPQQLQQAFNQAYRQADWQRAVSVGLELERVMPDTPDHRYNLACVFALGGNLDAAVLWLQRAASSGFTRISLLESDPDLDEVRGHEGYAVAVAAVERNRLLLRAAIKERFQKSQPLLFRPPKHDASKPSALLIALHGLGGRAQGYPTFWRRTAAKNDTVLVVPQGVRPSAGGYSWNDPDEADMILDLTLEWARERVAVDPERIALTGFSQGGYIAMALGLRHPDLFIGVIPMAGGYIPEIDAPPEAGVQGPRYYFMVGAEDDNEGQCRRAAEDFAEAGYEVELRVFPGVGHSFPRNTNRELGKALRFVLGR